MSMMPPLDYALAYARAGYCVIPCRGKIPLTEHGAKDASGDEGVITGWWQRWPDANIGLALDGLVAVDIDPRNGGNVDHLPHPLPETCYAKTGGGGWHYLYRAHNGTRYPGTLGTGIDIKAGASSYIVVEPSVHASGEKYVWMDETEPWTTTPATAPDWLARPAGPKASGTQADGIGEGRRNAHLTSLAGTLQRRAVAPAAILAALQAENAARCMPPLTDDEVAKIAESVTRYTPAPSTESHGWPAALDLETLAGRDPHPPESIMAGLPCGYATATFAHGGTGKSQIELMRGVCIAMGIPFCGLETKRRRVLFVSCEDRADILHWRLTRLCAYLGIDLASLAGWLHILDLVGHRSILFAPDPRTGLALTAAYGALAERIKEYGTEVLILDGIADVFGGNENARVEVKQFVNELLALIPPATGAVLLIGHVNKVSASGGATNEGYSGSTAWHNSARARWFLYPETLHGEDGGRAARTGKLILELQKANHGEVGTQIEFQWDVAANLFVGRLVADAMDFDRTHRDQTERRGILLSLKACTQSTPAIMVPAATTGQRTAYNTLAERPEFPDTLRSGKPGRTRFWRHIEALRQKNAIEEASYRRTNRHLTAHLVITSEGLRQCAE
jgi:AAA domain/Bifunctional DNA primase/polymerase, N-terminal/Primase C terminal 1 (PriCT-1)